MARMDFGIGLGAELRFDEIADHARVADEGGYTHLTFVDQSNVSRECFGMMTIAAMNTRRIHIGQGVCATRSCTTRRSSPTSLRACGSLREAGRSSASGRGRGRRGRRLGGRLA